MRKSLATDEKELKQKIINIREISKDFIIDLGKRKRNNREKIVNMNYKRQLRKKAKWLKNLTSSKNSKNEFLLNKNGKLTDVDVKLISLLKQIKSQPNKQNILVQQFLNQFPEIEETDREVLIANFRDLSEKELKQELINLIEIFGK